MALNNAAAAFIGASVTLVLVIIFMILMVILVRQCLAFLAKRNSLRAQTEQQLQARRQFERQRRGSVTEPVPATFDWHHSIRIAGTPPPSYTEAKGLPKFSDGAAGRKKKRGRRERGRDQEQTDGVIVTRTRSLSQGDQQQVNGNDEEDGGGGGLQVNNHQRRHTSPQPLMSRPEQQQNGSVPQTAVVIIENHRNSEMMTTETVQVAVDIETSNAENVEMVVSAQGQAEPAELEAHLHRDEAV